MKVFEHGSKVNFVDENNVVLGYDMEQRCCEDAGWFIAEYPECEDINNADEGTSDIEGFVFDTAFFREGNWEDGQDDVVVFRMYKGDEAKYLHLYNIHNGYYSHGFEFFSNNTLIHDGAI